MFLDPPAEIVPYARFLDARQRRHGGRVVASLTPEPLDPDTNAVAASPGPTVEKAAVAAVPLDAVSDLCW